MMECMKVSMFFSWNSFTTKWDINCFSLTSIYSYSTKNFGWLLRVFDLIPDAPHVWKIFAYMYHKLIVKIGKYSRPMGHMGIAWCNFSMIWLILLKLSTFLRWIICLVMRKLGSFLAPNSDFGESLPTSNQLVWCVLIETKPTKKAASHPIFYPLKKKNQTKKIHPVDVQAWKFLCCLQSSSP